jgi:hypothetical protein
MNVKKLILKLKLGVSHITHKGKVARLKAKSLKALNVDLFGAELSRGAAVVGIT